MAGYYLPSIKGGGPIQSIKNMVDNLSDKIDFYVVAADRDLGDDRPFPNIKTEEWLNVGNAKVFYVNPSQLTWKKTTEIISSINYDVMYLNSFFSYKFSIVPIILNKCGKLSSKPIVLAPRGQFSQGALSLKSKKKYLYIRTAKIINLYKDIIWHATAEIEKKDIEYIFGMRECIRVANNLTASYNELIYEKKIDKLAGELKIAFISRIHPKKNLKKALEFLKNVNGKIEFNIYGPLEDKVYWTECEKVIDNLSESISVSYKGIANHDSVIDIFKSHHVFLFPTLGENFGHVISEGLIGGCPVIISDQTPWRDLERVKAGWDIKLNEESKFQEILQLCTDLSQSQYNLMSKAAFEYGKLKSNIKEDISKTYDLFI
jgi:glycosyltransferase involved in cell wall biosynthesis